MDMSTKQFRAEYTMVYNQQKTDEYNRIMNYYDQGLSTTEIGRKIGKNESSVRSLINSGIKARQDKSVATAELIKNRVDEVGMVQVGSGVEHDLGITRNRLDTALAMLQNEGYEIYSARVPQVTDPKGNKQTTYKVVAPPGTPSKDRYNYGEIHSLIDYTSKDGGETFVKNNFNILHQWILAD